MSHSSDGVREVCGGIDPFVMNKVRISFIGTAILLLSLSQIVHGLSGTKGFIDLDLWTEVSEIIPAINNDENSYLTDTEISRRVLEDAAWIISGMIYGFDVIYTPLDLSRDVDEYLEIIPVASILWGDPKLEIIDSWVKNEKLFLHVRYFLDNIPVRLIYPSA